MILLGVIAYLAFSTIVAPGSPRATVVERAEAFVVESPSLPGTAFDAVLEPRSIPVHVPSSVLEPSPATEPAVSSTSESAAPGQSSESATNPPPGSVAVLIEPLPVVFTTGDAVPPEIGQLNPTYSWVNAFSAESTLDGEPLPVDSVVTAYDPDGVLIGRAVVQRLGEYGAMPLYMDDPATEIDEGASSGDIVRFEINGLLAVVLGPSEPVWIANGAALVLNLAGSSRDKQ